MSSGWEGRPCPLGRDGRDETGHASSTSSPDSISGLVSRVRLAAHRSSPLAISPRESGPCISTSIATARSAGLSGAQLSVLSVSALIEPSSSTSRSLYMFLDENNGGPAGRGRRYFGASCTGLDRSIFS